MKASRITFLVGILAILLLAGIGYSYRANINRVWHDVFDNPQPCQKPISYTIANLDPRFGLTRTDALAAIQRAEKIWESPIGKQLFAYAPDGDLKINFVYDYRQKATDALKEMGIVIHNDRATYDTLKTKYATLVSLYNEDKARLDALIADYNAKKTTFENDVRYWNSRGGAPKAEYAILEQERIDLNNQAATINQLEDSMNVLVDSVNSIAAILNRLIDTLNLHVNTYNEVGASVGKEFREGEYVSGANGTAINIFQFDNTDQLVRVLAHELGHALGLKHLNNPQTIMYYLNEGVNEKLTSDDLAALKSVCGIK